MKSWAVAWRLQMDLQKFTLLKISAEYGQTTDLQKHITWTRLTFEVHKQRLKNPFDILVPHEFLNKKSINVH